MGSAVGRDEGDGVGAGAMSLVVVEKTLVVVETTLVVDVDPGCGGDGAEGGAAVGAADGSAVGAPVSVNPKLKPDPPSNSAVGACDRVGARVGAYVSVVGA